uniref:Centriolar coiled coil protein 110kDa n=1 Tax=Elaeophora elaphi TaxID=1147741 RepID=A0A0R3RGI6_9BILA
MVPPSTKNSGDELTNGTFDPADTSTSSVDLLIAPERDDLDFRIRQRLEASRQGMLQLEALRNKHQKLMKEMRIRLPHRNNEEQARDGSGKPKESSDVNSQTEMKFSDLRCDSPVSCCVSHRSSVSMDSGCVSLSSDFSSQSPMPSSTSRKFSLEDQRKKTDQQVTTAEVETDENQQLVAMVIESTTALHCHKTKCATNWPRSKSMCFNCTDENSAIVVDSLSFSQITPPPIHRKFFTVGRSENVQTRRPCLATSSADIHFPIMLRKEQSPTCFPVNQSPMLNAKPIAISLSSKIPTSPYMRLRDPQKPLQNSRVKSHHDSQSIFHASRIFVDHSPRIVQCRKQRMNIERFDSDEESPRLLRAQPAVVLSRQGNKYLEFKKAEQYDRLDNSTLSLIVSKIYHIFIVLSSSLCCRQQSYAHSNESSPCELRKVHLIESANSQSNATLLEYHQQLNRCESSHSSETIISDRPHRRKMEKDWKESEDL